MRRLRHPSGCDCPPPVISEGGDLVLSVSSCPICLAWEAGRRSAGWIQVELLPTEEGRGTAETGHETLDEYAGPDPSEILREIRSLDPSF